MNATRLLKILMIALAVAYASAWISATPAVACYNGETCHPPPPEPDDEPGVADDDGGGGGGGGTTTTPTVPPQTTGTVPTGSFPSVPPQVSGSLNESEGRQNIDDALDLFGADGIVAGALAAGDGGDLDTSLKKDGGSGNLGKGNGTGFGSAVGLSDSVKGGFGDSDGNSGRGLAGTVSAGGTGSLTDSELKDGKENAEALAAQAMFGSGEGEGKFGDGTGHGGTGAGGAGGNEATTGEVGNDGPGGAGRGAGENADEYLKRTGKLSLFEIVNRRYEIWGSQIQR